MKRIDDNLKDSVRFETSDKMDWLQNHTLSEEQFRQLVFNKYERARRDRENLEKLKSLLMYD
jgi:hypothetical protein